jgi:hypothetical protein
MRDDMARVIVERPRIPDHRRRKGRDQPLEDLPAHEGMRRPHLLNGEGKTLNENLRPLRRYLDRQVGRPWNKVYADIAANLRVDNTVQQHVRDHLRDFVATNKLIEVGPAIDDPASWRAWRREHGDRRYAVAKRALSRRELRRHGLRNGDEDDVEAF